MATCSDCVVEGNNVNEVKEGDEAFDPGAAPFGNFINYYTFNPPENRLSLIPASLLQDLGFSRDQQSTLILDVGCNSGVRQSGGSLNKTFQPFIHRLFIKYSIFLYIRPYKYVPYKGIFLHNDRFKHSVFLFIFVLQINVKFNYKKYYLTHLYPV